MRNDRGNIRATAPIIVGVDGSTESIQAMRWAVAHAADFETTVEAVFVMTSGPSLGVTFSSAADELSVVQAAGDELARTVRRALGESDAEEVAITVVSGSLPTEALGDATRRASYLVLGAGQRADKRGDGESCVSSLLPRAHCPVIFVPSEQEPATAPAG